MHEGALKVTTNLYFIFFIPIVNQQMKGKLPYKQSVKPESVDVNSVVHVVVSRRRQEAFIHSSRLMLT